MSQQINLFNPVFLKQKKYFSAATMVQGLALLLLGVLAMAGYADYQIRKLEQQANTTTAQLAAVQAGLTKLSENTAPRAKNKMVEEETRNMQAKVDSIQQALDMLEKGDLGNTKGYSAYFRAFSHQIVDGLWLTGADIHGAGNDIELKGRALRPESVPVYIGRMRHEPVMQGKSFATLEMTVPKAILDRKPAGQLQSGKENLSAAKQEAANFVEFRLQSMESVQEKTEFDGARK